ILYKHHPDHKRSKQKWTAASSAPLLSRFDDQTQISGEEAASSPWNLLPTGSTTVVVGSSAPVPVSLLLETALHPPADDTRHGSRELTSP
ncbi:hypothetical protein AVEN_180315-1, partial [Araneus ventricosus]